jgi:hypothetical protein
MSSFSFFCVIQDAGVYAGRGFLVFMALFGPVSWWLTKAFTVRSSMQPTSPFRQRPELIPAVRCFDELPHIISESRGTERRERTRHPSTTAGRTAGPNATNGLLPGNGGSCARLVSMQRRTERHDGERLGCTIASII